MPSPALYLPYVQAALRKTYLNTQRMDTKLTDFTFKELTFLSLRMEDVQKDAQSKIELIQQFENSTIKDELLEFHQEAYEMASLWRTQAQIAQVSIKKDEIARSN